MNEFVVLYVSRFRVGVGETEQGIRWDFGFEKAKNFLKTLRKRNPKATIFWAFGMLGAELLPVIETTIKEYADEEKDNKVEVVLLPQAEGDGVGARSHPGVINHRQAAEVLVKKIMEHEA